MERRSRRSEMNQKKNLSSSIRSATFISTIALALMIGGASAGKLFAAAADSLDQLYEKAKKEGKITLYAALWPRRAMIKCWSGLQNENTIAMKRRSICSRKSPPIKWSFIGGIRS